MIYYLIYNHNEKCFVSNLVCGTRTEANKFCDLLEKEHGGIFTAIKFVDGVQITTI